MCTNMHKCTAAQEDIIPSTAQQPLSLLGPSLFLQSPSTASMMTTMVMMMTMVMVMMMVMIGSSLPHAITFHSFDDDDDDDD